MDKNDLKRKLNRRMDQLSDNIELKEINMKELPPLSEAESDDFANICEKRTNVGYGSYRLLAAVASLMLLITAFLIYYGTIATYSKVEIVGVPALTIYMKDSRVVKIKAMDRDSESFIDGIETDQPLSDVLDYLFLRMQEKECFKGGNNLDISIKGPDKEELERQVSVQAENLLGNNTTTSVSINHKKVVKHDQHEDVPEYKETENTETNIGPDNNLVVDKEIQDRTSDRIETNQKEIECEDLNNYKKSQADSQESAEALDKKSSMEDDGFDLSTEDSQENISHENSSQENDSQIGEDSDKNSSENDSGNQSSIKKKKKKKVRKNEDPEKRKVKKVKKLKIRKWEATIKPWMKRLSIKINMRQILHRVIIRLPRIMGEIKKRKEFVMKKIMIILIILLIAIWPLSIAKAEFLSALHANEFKGLYSQTHMIGGHPKPKVLKYSPDSAKIYYVNKDGGDVLWFEKKEEQWKMKDWDTVWARGGSADGCVWPYIFDCFVNTSPLFANNSD